MAKSGVYVEGVREVVRSLERLGVAVTDLKAVFKNIGNKVVSDAQSLVPRKSGRLAATIKSSNAKNKAIVRAGSARVPYAGVQEYGGYNNIAPSNYLRGAVEQNQAYAVKTMDDGLRQLIRQYDLN